MYQVIHLIMLKEGARHLPFSGAENHLFCLLQAQRAAGVKVELGVLLRRGGRTLEETFADLQRQGIEVRCFPYEPLVDGRCLNALRRHLIGRRDYIVHTHLDQADLMGKVAARLAGCRHVISTVHNNEPYHARWRWLYTLRLLDRWTRRHIAISGAVQRQLIDLEGVPPEKVHVIPYGVWPPAVRGDRGALRARLGLPQDGFVVGFVGRLVEQKNVPLLLDAMAGVPNAVCALVGSGAQRPALEVHAARFGIDARFFGQLPKAETLMPAFDVLCLPSRWEGLGLVLIEAMLQGVPIVGSRAGAIPEVLGNGEYGMLFNSEDREGLVAALNRARTEGPALAAKAYRHAVEYYAVEKMVERTLAVYGEVMASHS
jgi:glycosyltransferase involved in cell wall biosynthesis